MDGTGGGILPTKEELGSINLTLLNSVSHFLSEAVTARSETNRKIHSNTQNLAGGAIAADRQLVQ